MKRSGIHLLGAAGLLTALLLTGGCLERELAITTEPAGAVVWLNDEEIGVTPVSVNFRWYGDYRVRIQKSGYEILETHQPLEAPFYDHFPLDLMADLWPGTIRDRQEWHFDLKPAVAATSEAIIERAQAFHQQAQQEFDAAREVIEQKLENH
jgi:hypothetical protein